MYSQCISFPMVKLEAIVMVIDNTVTAYHLDQNFAHNNSITTRIAAGKDLTDVSGCKGRKGCSADTESCTLATDMLIVIKVGNISPDIMTTIITVIVCMLIIAAAEAIVESKHIEIVMFVHTEIDLSGQHRLIEVTDFIDLDFGLQVADTVCFVIVNLEVRFERNFVGNIDLFAVVAAVGRFVDNIEIGLGYFVIDKAVVVQYCSWNSLVG
jgi:hypothetical protein